MRFTNRTLLAVPLITLGLISGCKKSEKTGIDSETESTVDFKKMSVPENFNYETTQSKALDIQVNLLGGDPYAGASFDVCLENPDLALDNDSLRNELTVISSLKLNEKGRYSSEIKLPSYVDTLYLRSKSVGIPAYFAIPRSANGYTLKYDAGAEVAKIQATSTAYRTAGKLITAGTLATARTWDYKGYPNYLEDPIYVSSRFLRRFQTAVPYAKKVNPALLSSSIPRDIDLRLNPGQTAQVSITYMFGTSFYKNTLGYYWYPTNNPPTSKSQIVNKGYIFPSTSRTTVANYSGLVAGQTVKLVGPNADGSFPPNTSIGFFLISNGFNPNANTANPGTITTTKVTYFSNKNFNSEGTGNMIGQKERMVTLYDEATNKIVWAFEDGVDADFSDVAFFATWTPDEAISTDPYPKLPTVPGSDADYVFYPSQKNKGTLMFEDCWPRLADFDMNDMVLNYRYTGALDESGKVSEVHFLYDLVSIAAEQNNSFAVMFPDIAPGNVKSITSLDLNNANKNTTSGRTFAVEDGHTNDVVVRVFDNASTILGGKVVNNVGSNSSTHAYETFSFTVKFKNSISVAEFNKISPFIIPRGARYIETHLANQRPSAKASKSYFQTDDDNSSDAASRYYLSNTNNSLGNITWGVDVPEQIPYPKTGSPMTKSYNYFAEWATSGGVNKKDWYKSNTGNRRASYLFYPAK